MATEAAAPGPELAAAERGCLVLADISGYTDYLLASELEHAQDVIADLTDVVVRNLRPVLRLSKLEGDAAFAYVLAGEYGPSTLLDTVEQTYFAFRSRLRDIAHATSCTCRACALMPTLDLKFVVHDGSFVRRRVGRTEELIGPDVVRLHRLAKNSAAAVLGTRGYGLLTEACVEALGLDPGALGMRRTSSATTTSARFAAGSTTSTSDGASSRSAGGSTFRPRTRPSSGRSRRASSPRSCGIG